jgi:hypothetical protein
MEDRGWRVRRGAGFWANSPMVIIVAILAHGPRKMGKMRRRRQDGEARGRRSGDDGGDCRFDGGHPKDRTHEIRFCLRNCDIFCLMRARRADDRMLDRRED